jgi:hypothetical protein
MTLSFLFSILIAEDSIAYALVSLMQKSIHEFRFKCRDLNH